MDEVTGRQLATIAGDLECVAVAGCGHLVPEERPEELAAHLARFLARTSSARTTPAGP